jgi:predicted Zn-ribbon and HTH transcriptional regulator
MSNGLGELLDFNDTIQDQNKAKGMIEPLEKDIEDFLWSLNDNNEYNEASYGGHMEKGFHPSAVCWEDCPKKLIFKYLELPMDYPEEEYIVPLTRRVFDNGHDVHDRWQRYFTLMSERIEHLKLVGDWKCKGCGYKFSPGEEIEKPKGPCPECKSERIKYNEFRIRYPKLRIVGKRDLKLIINGEEFLGEIKSMNTSQFNGLYKPLPKHIKQFALYMLSTGTHKGFFLYENKNDQKTKFFYYEYAESDIERELNLLKLANEALETGEFPKWETPKKVCKTCVYRKTCPTLETVPEGV